MYFNSFSNFSPSSDHKADTRRKLEIKTTSSSALGVVKLKMEAYCHQWCYFALLPAVLQLGFRVHWHANQDSGLHKMDPPEKALQQMDGVRTRASQVNRQHYYRAHTKLIQKPLQPEEHSSNFVQACEKISLAPLASGVDHGVGRVESSSCYLMMMSPSQSCRHY